MTELPGAFRQIAERAHQSNLARVEELAAAITSAAAGRLDEQAQSDARDVAHKLAGSAGTFGYDHTTMLARRLEDLLGGAPLLAGPGIDAANEWVAAIRIDLGREPDDE